MLPKKQFIFAASTFFVSLIIISQVHARSQEIVQAMPFIPTPTLTITPSPTPTLTPTPTSGIDVKIKYNTNPIKSTR